MSGNDYILIYVHKNQQQRSYHVLYGVAILVSIAFPWMYTASEAPVIIGSGSGLSHARWQAIYWTNIGMLSTENKLFLWIPYQDTNITIQQNAF